MHKLELGLYSHPKEFWRNEMLTPREKSPLPEKFSLEKDRTHDAASSRAVIPKHYQRVIPAPLSLSSSLVGSLVIVIVMFR